MLSTPVEPRRTVELPRLAYAHVAAVIGLALFASGTPSPLYGTYRELWGFSPVVLTLIYATYAFGVLAALLLAGRLSDEIGRRPVLLAALGTLMATTVLFMLADSTAWLFVARGIQGLATGLALGAASAALLDLHPTPQPRRGRPDQRRRQRRRDGPRRAASPPCWSSSRPRRACSRTSSCSCCSRSPSSGALRMPEPVEPTRASVRLTPQRPTSRRAVRRPFFLAALAVISSWSIGGLFLSLGPALSAQALPHRQPPRRPGSASSRWPARAPPRSSRSARTAPWAGAAGGSLALATGMVAIVLAAGTETPALFWIGSLIGGAGFGVAFLGGLRALSGRDPAPAPRRGHVGVLHRRLPGDLAARDPGRRRW